MKKAMTSLALATSLVAFAGCSKKKEEGTVQKSTEGSAAVMPPPPPKPEAPKKLEGAALADKYKACIAQIGDGKLDEFQKDCLDASFVVHNISDPNPHSAADLVGYLKAMKAAMPDMKMQPQLVMVSGRNLLAVNLVTGTQTAELKSPGGMNLPASNKKLGMLMFHKLAMNDANLANEEWFYNDPTTMLGQLGAAPKGAPPTRPAMEKGIEGAPIVVVTADDDKEKANLANARKAIDAINAGKFADVLALMAPDAVVSDQAAEKDVKGTKEIEANMKMWFGAFKDAKFTIDSDYAAGDYVIQLGKFSGTNDKDIGKMVKKTGKTVALDVADVIQVKDGKAAQLWRFHSGMQFAMQMGLMPAPGAPPAGGAAAGSAAAPAGETKGSAAPTGEPKKEPAK